MEIKTSTPLKRFSAYWSGIAIMLVFALILSILWFFLSGEKTNIEDLVAKDRYKTLEMVRAADHKFLSPEAIEAGMDKAAKQLLDSKEQAVLKPQDATVAPAPVAPPIKPEPVPQPSSELQPTSSVTPFTSSIHSLLVG